ncbi:MAG: hypothetical protein LBQ74_14530 [Prevotella sp.]|nr:hypothetical protein [Prevotella sp.]
MGILAQSCRALPGLSSLLALPKSKQKASASFDLTPRPLQREREPKPVCRLKVTNGLSPRPFLSRLHRTGARLRH